MEEAVGRHGGVLTSFLGDGAMAVFGLPTPKADDASRALNAARELARGFAKWAPLRIGIGLHTGTVAIAQVGGREQLQITATGDTVNLASRLEGLTREHDAYLALSEAAHAAVSSTELRTGLQHLGNARIRGRRAPVGVWLLPRTHLDREVA